MSIFEIGMLVCFGLSWPFAIIRSYKTKTSKGKTPLFTIFLALGYIFGITNKILYSRDIVIFFYCLNLCMVLIELYLYFRNLKFDKEKKLVIQTN